MGGEPDLHSRPLPWLAAGVRRPSVLSAEPTNNGESKTMPLARAAARFGPIERLKHVGEFFSGHANAVVLNANAIREQCHFDHAVGRIGNGIAQQVSHDAAQHGDFQGATPSRQRCGACA